MPQPTHRAVCRDRNGALAMQSISLPNASRYDVVVKPLMVGICGTDLQILRGQRGDTATILGHEGIGTVVWSGATGLHAGDLVVFNPVNPLAQDDILGHSCDGLLQECVLVDAAHVASGTLLPMDRDVPAALGALVEPLGTVVYSQELIGRAVIPRSLAVIGAGPAGMLQLIYARRRGIGELHLISRSAPRLQWAVEHGLVAAQNAHASLDVPARVRGVDAAAICADRSGALQALAMAAEIVREGGCIDLFGGTATGDRSETFPDIELNQIRRANVCGLPESGVLQTVRTANGKRVVLTGHRGTSAKHLRAAMNELKEAPAGYGILVSHVIALEDAPRVLTELATPARSGFEGVAMKVIVDMQAGSRT
jgi:2-epi-valiolone-7-phosphate 1-reductase